VLTLWLADQAKVSGADAPETRLKHADAVQHLPTGTVRTPMAPIGCCYTTGNSRLPVLMRAICFIRADEPSPTRSMGMVACDGRAWRAL
jgi:hypothetical protein